MKDNKQMKKKEYQQCNCGLFWPIDIKKIKRSRDGMHYYVRCPRCKRESYIDFNKRSLEFKEQVFRKKY